MARNAIQQTMTSIASHILARLMRPSNSNRNQTQSIAVLHPAGDRPAAWGLVARREPRVRARIWFRSPAETADCGQESMTRDQKVRNAGRLRAQVNRRIGRRCGIRSKSVWAIGTAQEKQLDDDPGLQKGEKMADITSSNCV